MAKKRIINLIEWRKLNQRCFVVDTVKNSIDFKAGQMITETEAHDLVSNSDWEVNLRKPRDADYK